MRTTKLLLLLCSLYTTQSARASNNEEQECEVSADGSMTCIETAITWDEAELDDIDPTTLPSEVIGLPCRDEDKACSYFRERRECMSNPYYMGVVCRVTCNSCDPDDPEWPNAYPRKGNVGMKQFVPTPEMHGEEFREEVLDIIREARRYLHEEVLVDDGYKYKEVQTDCTNRHEMCSVWTNQDECNLNKPYMKQNCMLSCQYCKEHHKYLHGMHF